MLKACFLFVLFLSALPLAAEDAVVSFSGTEVRFLEKERFITITDLQSGPLLVEGVILVQKDDAFFSTLDRNLAWKTNVDRENRTLSLRIPDSLICRITIGNNGSVVLRTDKPEDGYALFSASIPCGVRGQPAMLQHEQESDRRVLTTFLGPAFFCGARSLFLLDRDLALTASSDGKAEWQRKDGWSLLAQASSGKSLLRLEIRRRYYRDTLGIEFYKPFRPASYWTTPPVVAMTWYGIEGWKGKPAQRKEWLYPQIDWVAEHLLPFAKELVFQLDDNYLFDDDAYMRDLSDYIRSKGLIPGIWFTPFGVADAACAERNSSWFLHDAEGRLLKAFGGVNFGDGKSSATAVLNTRNPEAVEACYAAFWKRASETWNFDFFKIDGQPQVADRYRKAKDGGGAAGYRKGLAIGRTIVGEEKFINGCWGTPLDAVGLVDGSRTGPDTGNHPHAIDVIVRWNFLNNICWWCDPDAAANLFKADNARVRLNAQARVLTGQQFLTDDVWTEVNPDCRRTWQRSFPSLAARPLNLYPIESWREYDLFDLRIARSWGTWDVVGLFNFDGRKATRELDLGRLSLDAEQVHLFEYWSSRYLGRLPAKAVTHRICAPYEGQLFSVVPASLDRPDLISTSRHLSQGGLDVKQLRWIKKDDGWIAEGRSSHLVKDDPYQLFFAANRYRAADCSVSRGTAEVVASDALAKIRIDPEQSGEVEWRVAFVPVTGTRFSVEPAVCDLVLGREACIHIQSRGTEAFEWKASVSDRRIKVSPQSGSLDRWPARSSIFVRVDHTGLPPEYPWGGLLFIEPTHDPGSKQTILLNSITPLPEDLALRAKASASSIWGPGYEAARVNDGDDQSRWNSRKGEKAGAWIELSWPEAVTCDSIVIDECIDYGHRIEAWRLESIGDTATVLARGEKIGRRLVLDLEKPTRLETIRLVIEKASEVPTIHEIACYRWR